MNPLAWPIAFARLLIRSALLALGQIWANKGRAILTTIGIVIGVGSVTAVIAALTGLQENVLRDFERFGVRKIHMFARRPNTPAGRMMPWWQVRITPDHTEGLLTRCLSVERFTLVKHEAAVARYREWEADVHITGIQADWHEIEQRFVQVGRPFSHMEHIARRTVCLITADLRDKLRLDYNCLGESIRIGDRPFVITGVIEDPAELNIMGMGETSNEVFVPFTTLWKRSEGGAYVVATSRSPEVVEEARAELHHFFRRQRRLGPGEPDDFRIETIQQHLDRFKTMARMITLVAGSIVAVSLVVGGVGIMNIMLVSVSERTREIGLRKAVGARPSAILLQFLVEAMMLCMIGGVFGLVAGHALTIALGTIPGAQLQNAYVPRYAVALGFGFSAAVGVIFGTFPALKAARLDPIEALRHE